MHILTVEAKYSAEFDKRLRESPLSKKVVGYEELENGGIKYKVKIYTLEDSKDFEEFSKEVTDYVDSLAIDEPQET